MMVEARIEGAAPIIGLPPSCHGNEDRILRPCTFAQLARGLMTIQMGHADVEDDDLRLEDISDLHSVLPIIGNPHVMPFEFQQQAKALRNVSVVIDYENPPGADRTIAGHTGLRRDTPALGG